MDIEPGSKILSCSNDEGRVTISVKSGWYVVVLYNGRTPDMEDWLNEFVGKEKWSYIQFGDIINFIIYGEEAAAAFKLAWL